MNLRSALLPLCLLAALPSLAAARGLDVRDLQKLDRVSSPVLSPDGSTVVFAKRIVDADVVKASSSLWVRNLLTRDMAPPKRLTPEGWNVNSPSFSPDGKTVYFLSAKSGTQQLYAMPLVGGAPRVWRLTKPLLASRPRCLDTLAVEQPNCADSSPTLRSPARSALMSFRRIGSDNT